MELYTSKLRAIIPSLITGLAMLVIWVALVLLIHEHSFLSLTFALLAFVVDFIDGWAARTLKVESDFGRQFDGASDIFIYLLYPAFFFHLYFDFQSYLAIVILFIFLVCGVYRLIRFNTMGYAPASTAQQRYYQGLPVVFSYVLILIFILWQGIAWPFRELGMSILILLMSYLMTRSWPFPKPRYISIYLILLLAAATYFFMQSL